MITHLSGIHWPVLRQKSKMKVALVILIFFNISSTLFRSPGMVRNWDNSLVGLDFLAFGNNHLDRDLINVIFD